MHNFDPIKSNIGKLQGSLEIDLLQRFSNSMKSVVQIGSLEISQKIWVRSECYSGKCVISTLNSTDSN